MKKHLIIFFVALMLPNLCIAQSLTDGLQYKVEIQSTVSDSKTPLWLNANRYGLSSLDKSNGYFRAAVERPLQTDSDHNFGLGYGIDMAAAYNFTSKVIVQQAYVEGRWLHGTLTIGSKEYPMELKNQQLSSGSQTLGINARPVPQVRLALPEYWTLPFGNGWLQIKGHIAYGKMTDDNWQHSFTGKKSRYADDVLYHSKAGYIRIGNEEMFCPWSLELGLEMAAEFGGTIYRPNENGEMEVFKGGTGLGDFWRAFVPGGAEVNEKSYYQNAEGNQLGSYLLRLNYDADDWSFSIYADHFFEDHSAMVFMDYDGYGTGDEWNTRKKSKYFLYSLKDMMLGTELKLNDYFWINNIVFEYLYTKYQSGPVYHDRTPSLSDHVGGIDDYYNHGVYTGWQHWGQVMGNPLYLSPIYNTDGTIYVTDNRFYAFHLGLSGSPTENLDYRVLATYQKGFGTYRDPYTKPKNDVSLLAEVTYRFSSKALDGFYVKGGIAADFGKIMGNNKGAQLTIGKIGLLNFKKKKH